MARIDENTIKFMGIEMAYIDFIKLIRGIEQAKEFMKVVKQTKAEIKARTGKKGHTKPLRQALSCPRTQHSAPNLTRIL